MAKEILYGINYGETTTLEAEHRSATTDLAVVRQITDALLRADDPESIHVLAECMAFLEVAPEDDPKTQITNASVKRALQKAMNDEKYLTNEHTQAAVGSLSHYFYGSGAVPQFQTEINEPKPSKQKQSKLSKTSKTFATVESNKSEEDEKVWQDYSNCLGVDPILFFPERGASTREAKEVCRGCIVREECLEYALSNSEKFGIWGGMSERERRKIRRQRALAKAANVAVITELE